VETNEAGEAWDVLGDRSRRAIVTRLAERPWAVGELADELPISRPAVSQHLRVLRDGGLVIAHAEGTRRIYQLNPEGVTALRAWLESVWSDALTGFQKTAEADSAVELRRDDPIRP
jgi:DNA-binding transcriptional ArsR family regulator